MTPLSAVRLNRFRGGDTASQRRSCRPAAPTSAGPAQSGRRHRGRSTLRQRSQSSCFTAGRDARFIPPRGPAGPAVSAARRGDHSVGRHWVGSPVGRAVACGSGAAEAGAGPERARHCGGCAATAGYQRAAAAGPLAVVSLLGGLTTGWRLAAEWWVPFGRPLRWARRRQP